MKQRKKVAVIGSGISGLSAAWFLGQKHDVTLLEKQSRLGGHTNSVWVTSEHGGFYVDTGFIVFNRPNYPNLTQMLQHLSVATTNTDMSFGVSINQGELEYAGSNLDTLFAQRKNLFSISHWKMIREILRFNRLAKASLNDQRLERLTLGEFLFQHKFSEDLQHQYLLPMAAAIWSCPTSTMMTFPVASFLRFFENHGLLNIEDRPQWETVTGGSIHYLEKIRQQQAFDSLVDQNVQAIKCLPQGVGVLCNQEWLEFDEVVLACHADESFELLSENCHSCMSDYDFLENFRYQKNMAYLHSDEALMPQNKKAWSSWNYLSDSAENIQTVSVSYWMNQLQPLPTDKDYFVTLNPIQRPQEDKLIKEIEYHHPVFDQAAMMSQSYLPSVQGKNGIWFVGSYCGYGFHEDGLASSVDLARRWGIRLPWEGGGDGN